MIILYSFLILMLVSALCFISLASEQTIFSFRFLFSSLIITFLSFGIYQFCGNKIALKNWLKGGEKHFQLVQQFDRMGGVEGAIAKIQIRLKENPDDRQGWLILSKLYLAKGDELRAQNALKKAQELN